LTLSQAVFDGVTGLKVGELAKATGMNASAIRYYERCGLLPAPYRMGGQRRYSSDCVHRMLLVRFASDMEFSLDEIRVFLAGLRDSTPVGIAVAKAGAKKIKRSRCKNPVRTSAEVAA
jgi:DNA-binding transcriptional MerR regulator